MYSEDYFSVELLKESPLKLYEAQYLNMGSQLDKMISEDVVFENKIIETFKHWVDVIIEKLKEFKKEFKKRINDFLTKVAKAKGDEVYENVKIPRIVIIQGNGTSKPDNTSKEFDFNRKLFSDRSIEHALEYVQYPKSTNGPYAIDQQYKVGEEWDETNKTLTKKEFDKIVETMAKDCDDISEKIYKTIQEIEDYAAKNFYDEDGNITDKEGIKRAKDAITTLEKMDKASCQYYWKFVKQS